MYTRGVDIWAVGTILGEMINSRPVFPGTSAINQIERIIEVINIPSKSDIEVSERLYYYYYFCLLLLLLLFIILIAITVITITIVIVIIFSFFYIIIMITYMISPFSVYWLSLHCHHAGIPS